MIQLASQLYGLGSSQFVRQVTVLTSGTALATAIPVLASPLLTRLYTPADFGLLALFMALVASITPAICGKYEVAMVLPKSRTQGQHLLGICLMFASAISIIVFLLVVPLKDQILVLLSAQQLGSWIYFVPLALLSTGFMTAMSYFANRHLDYTHMAKGKTVNALSVVVISILLGTLGAGFSGLLTGTIVGLVGAAGYLLYLYRTSLSPELLVLGRAKVEIMKRYSDYPLYNASTGLLNGFTATIPVFFLTHYFEESIVGYFALVSRVAQAPLSFISESVSQVNLKRVSVLVSVEADLRPYIIKVTTGLVAIVAVPTIIVMLFSPAIFTFLFGEVWRDAGTYMQILMPAIAVRFIASTLSTTLGATQNNALGALWKVTSFIVTFAIFALYAPRRDPISLFKAVVVMDVALYLFYYVLIWKAARHPRRPSEIVA